MATPAVLVYNKRMFDKSLDEVPVADAPRVTPHLQVMTGGLETVLKYTCRKYYQKSSGRCLELRASLQFPLFRSIIGNASLYTGCAFI